jgi:branched-chain amino acid aminotransferase
MSGGRHHRRPPFGRYHTDHMVSITYSVERGWHDACVLPYSDLPLDPAAIVLHYGAMHFRRTQGIPVAGGVDRLLPPDD